MRLVPGELEGAVSGDCLEMAFVLPAGAYATAVLRERVGWVAGDD